MADIKLIALDLDGTLLTTDKRLTDRTKETLKAARDRGIKVVLTTGRPLKAMDFFLHELGTDGQEDEYTITFNGGLVQKIQVKSLIRQSFHMMMWHACMKKQRNYHCLLTLSQKELFIKFNRTKKVFMPNSIQL